MASFLLTGCTSPISTAYADGASFAAISTQLSPRFAASHFIYLIAPYKLPHKFTSPAHFCLRHHSQQHYDKPFHVPSSLHADIIGDIKIHFHFPFMTSVDEGF